MRLKEIYSTRQPAVSVEFFPPKTPQGEANLAARIPVIASLRPAFVSVTYGAGGGTREKTLSWARKLRHEFGLEVMCHLTCIGHSREDIDSILDTLTADGVENIIALRGDAPQGETEWRPHPDGYTHAAQLVRCAREKGRFGIAVAGFPEVHPEARNRESDIRFLAEKVAAGADAVITQLFFDNDDYFRFVDEARAAGVQVPIVPGILPFKTAAQLRKFTTVYARAHGGPACIPDKLLSRLPAVENDDAAATRLGIEYAIGQCRELLDRGAPGIHFYCLNESHAVEEIMSALRLVSRPPGQQA